MKNDYDVVVVGGGIHGASVAQAVAACGKSILLLEQNSIASGTSSRSSKLIHGGLRYLETAQFSLVRECLTERSLLLKNAPELVRLIPFYFPLYDTTSRRPWQIRAGLSLYSILGGFGTGSRFKSIPRHQWNQLDGLDVNGLQKVFQYYDAQTDDAALTRAVIQSAIQLGAEVKVPATVTEIKLEDKGSQLSYQENEGGLQHCKAKVVVNAAGPWINKVLDRVQPQVPRLEIELMQGTHILIDHKVQQGIYYIESPVDHRAVFVMPWEGKTLIGTTETLYKGDPADVMPLDEEKQYLFKTALHYFPELTGKEIVDAFAGLRVLPLGAGSAFTRPRDVIFLPDRPGHPRIVTIYGGKLTAYRKTAEKLLLSLKSTLDISGDCKETRAIPLYPVEE